MGDDDPPCARTDATLLIRPGEIDPPEITARLGIGPSSWQRRGEVVERVGCPPWAATSNPWPLTSRGRVDSRDPRRHIAWLLDRLGSKAEAVRLLQGSGCRLAISCDWASRGGHGGPTIPPARMRRLAELDIESGFDIDGPFEEGPLSGGGR